MTSKRRVPILLLAIAMIVAACGSDGDTTDTTAATTTTAPPSTDTTEPAETTTTEPEMSEWDSTLAAAQEEGEAVWYGTEVETWTDAVGPLMAQMTGVTFVAAPRAATGAILERVSGEITAGSVGGDVLLVADHSVWVDNPDWFVDLDTAGLPNYASYPDEHKWNNKCVNVTLVTGGITYNTELVDAEHVPTSWEDLLDPYWAGQFALTDPRSSPTYNGWAFLMEQEYGVEFLEGIAAQNPDLFDSASPAAEQVAAGAYLISAMAHITNSSAIRAAGAPVAFVIPDGPTVGHGSCAGILANSPNPNAAKVMLDFLMSPEAHSAGCDAGVENASPLQGTTCLPLPDGWLPTPKDTTNGQFIGQTDDAGKERVYAALGIS
jgi:iron(III) transport system substrate-binding protein